MNSSGQLLTLRIDQVLSDMRKECDRKRERAGGSVLEDVLFPIAQWVARDSNLIPDMVSAYAEASEGGSTIDESASDIADRVRNFLQELKTAYLSQPAPPSFDDRLSKLISLEEITRQLRLQLRFDTTATSPAASEEQQGTLYRRAVTSFQNRRSFVAIALLLVGLTVVLGVLNESFDLWTKLFPANNDTTSSREAQSEHLPTNQSVEFRCIIENALHYDTFVAPDVEFYIKEALTPLSDHVLLSGSARIQAVQKTATVNKSFPVPQSGRVEFHLRIENFPEFQRLLGESRHTIQILVKNVGIDRFLASGEDILDQQTLDNGIKVVLRRSATKE